MTNLGGEARFKPFGDPHDSLRRLFRQGFTAEDLAEPLVSYDFDQPAAAVGELMRFRSYDVAGVRAGGIVSAWIQREDLTDGVCCDHMRPVEPSAVVPSRMPLAELLPRFAERRFVFVAAFGAIAGIVTRADLEKPAVRMWLFGILSLVEQALGEALVRRHPEGSWESLLSPARLARARALQRERRRRSEELALVECLSFGDKWWVLFKDNQAVARAGFESRTVARQRMQEFEALRNRLAHGHLLAGEDLTVAIRWAQRLDGLLELVTSGVV